MKPEWDSKIACVQDHLRCTGRVISVLQLKCRDRDRQVQLSAYELLASMDSEALHASMRPAHWREVINAGLGVCHSAQQSQGEHLPSNSCSHSCMCPKMKDLE